MRLTAAPECLSGALSRLGSAVTSCILFGGWAEELQDLRPPEPHGDVDLLLPAPDFVQLEQAMAGRTGFREIRAKRFAHKRAYSAADGLMIEFVLVTPEHAGPVTRFWGDIPFRWLEPLTDCSVRLADGDLAVASCANLIRYRRRHRSFEPWRWRDPGSLVG